MGRIARFIAFLFKLLNFIFDCLQTWQYTAGGGMSGVIAAIMAYYKNLPYWALPFVAIATGVLVVVLLALIFKTFTAKKQEEKRLRKLPRLVFDIHKRICGVRERLVKHTDWDKVDTSKVLLPMMEAAFSGKLEQPTSTDFIDNVASTFNKIGESVGGPPTVLNTYMKEGDVSIERALQRILWYRVLVERLDSYKPYPNDDIRNSVQDILDASLSFNNAMLLLSYCPEEPSVEGYSTLAGVSKVKAQHVYVTVKNVEKIMGDYIEKRGTRLMEQVDDYLSKREARW